MADQSNLYPDPNAPHTSGSASPDVPPDFYTPPPGMSQEQFQAWFQNAAGGVPSMRGTDPNQAWTAYQQGNFHLATHAEGQSGLGTYPWYADPGAQLANPILWGLGGPVIPATSAIVSGIAGSKLQDMMGGGGAAPTAAPTTTPPSTPAAGGMPGYTTENLKQYTQNYLIPALGAMNQMLQGDEKQWGSAIDNIMKIGGSGTSQIGNILKMDLAANIPLENQMFVGQGAQAIAQPWLDMVSNYMGQQLAAGSKALGVSATNQAILPYLAQIPGYLQSVGINAPTTGATGTTGGIPALTQAPNYNQLVPQAPIPGLGG